MAEGNPKQKAQPGDPKPGTWEALGLLNPAPLTSRVGELVNPMPLARALGQLPAGYMHLMQQGGAGLADFLAGQDTTPPAYNPQDHINATRGIAIDHAQAMKEIAREGEPAESRRTPAAQAQPQRPLVSPPNPYPEHPVTAWMRSLGLQP